VTLDGRGVLVVGGGSARGRAVALLAAARGAAVVFSTPPGDETLPAEFERIAGGRASGVVADPGREDDAERLFGAAVARLPRVDVVVHAVSDPPTRRFMETSRAEWDGAVARALRAGFLVSRLAVEEFLAHGKGGRLVHIAPLVRPAAPGQALAAASLHALLSLMRSTAKEYGPRRVACNAVVPVPSDAAGPTGDAVAEAVLFLASPEASYVNGEALRVSSSAT
jgi:NAD(P)-dependent dehydrogenase (short-subunit alcohol dehydrogenase family)